MEYIDIVNNIFQYFGIKEIIIYSTINKLIKRACDMQFWRLLVDDYGSEFKKIFSEYDGKQAYIKCYELNYIKKQYNINDTLINFFNATKINLTDMKINKLPNSKRSCPQMIHLRELFLSRSEITKIPKSIIYTHFLNLRILVLNDNHIQELPNLICKLIDLEVLLLDNNRIKQLPESIGKLVKLQTLYLSNNHIEKLPESIGQLDNLQELRLDYNRIKEFPMCIKLLTNLYDLSLCGNWDIQEFPNFGILIHSPQILFAFGHSIQINGLYKKNDYDIDLIINIIIYIKKWIILIFCIISFNILKLKKSLRFLSLAN
jgi:Leucine-rich repeat (LRR) protein